VLSGLQYARFDRFPHCGYFFLLLVYCRYGECDGDARDANFVTRLDADGNERVFGSIQVGSDVCQIFSDSDGNGQVECAAVATFPSEKPAPPVPSNTTSVRHRNLLGYTPSTTKHSVRGRRLFNDAGTILDMMVVWTKEAECKMSRLDYPCTLTPITEDNMLGLIDLAILETNVAFTLSGGATQLRLVHAYRDDDHIETNLDDDLISLTMDNDGKLDKVHDMRSLYGADAVQMIVGTFPVLILCVASQRVCI
jgi:hypothetical protein